MKKNFTLILGLFFVIIGAIAQAPFCGTGSDITEKIYEKSEEARNNRAELEKFTQEFIKNNAQKKGANDRIIIPMVFHIVANRKSGSVAVTGNITDAQVYDAVKVINTDYAKRNADTANTVAAFKDIAAKVGVEFRIARIDPYGACTNGILRYKTIYSDSADERVKDTAQAWPTNKYLNVWIVRQIKSGAGGYAFLPGSAPTNHDGIIIVNSQFGSIGTSSASCDLCAGSLTHEIGHFFNLQHTWGPTNNPGVKSNCDFDDGVDDTPLCIGAKSCGFNNDSCGPIANVQNYMDYAGCYTMFTEGQKARMLATLHSTIAGRLNLWSESNLKATGVFDNNAYFVGCDRKLGCEGSEVKYDLLPSIDSLATPVHWDFPGGIPSSSDLVNPVVLYPTAGTYDATLTIGEETSIRTAAVKVVGTTAWYGAGSYNESFEYTYLTDNGWYAINSTNDAVKWELVKGTSSAGTSCLKINSYDSKAAKLTDDLISAPLDFSAATSGALEFSTALAKKLDRKDTGRVFKVEYSINCGRNWKKLRYFTGDELSSSGFVNGRFKPTEPSQWLTSSIPLDNTVLGKSNVLIRMRFESTLYVNDFYLDDFKFTGVVAINDMVAKNLRFEIFPNPAEKNTSISFNLIKTENVKISIFDVLGREVNTINENALDPGAHKINLTIENKGIYFVKLQVGETLFTKKLIIN
jgi:hypothetical protein